MSKVMETVLKQGITTIPEITDVEIEKLQERHDSMLGVEKAAKESLATQITKLRAAKELSGASVLSTRAFRWRWAKTIRAWTRVPAVFSTGIPLPRLTLLRTDTPHVRLSVNSRRGELSASAGSSGSAFPKAWANNLKDIEAALRRAYDWDSVSLRFTWDGAIPDDAREQILLAQKDFGENDVFLLAEAPANKWKFDAPPPRAFADPLILGHRGGLFFYLGQFNPTQIEQYAALEFTS